MPTQHRLELKQDSCLVNSRQRFKIKWQLLYEQDAQQFVAKALANKVTEM